MKRFFVFSFLLVVVCATSCSFERVKKARHITYQEYIDKIWDFEKHPDTFVFKGNTAVIVDFYSKSVLKPTFSVHGQNKSVQKCPQKSVNFRTNIARFSSLVTSLALCTLKKTIYDLVIPSYFVIDRLYLTK